MSTIRVIQRDTRDIVGEGPIWSPNRNSVLWVDIVGQQLHQLSLQNGSIKSWPVPERIGWIIERKGSPNFIVGLKSGFAQLQLDPLSIVSIGNPEPERPNNRLNDAKADSAGRIWAGSMDDRELEASGALYRLDPDFRWSRHDDGYLVANGPTFSPDGKTIYHTDSGRRLVFAFDLLENGALAKKRVFLEFKQDWGFPDGMTTDAEGGIWIAPWGGARISRFNAAGNLMRAIPMPCTNITNITFAGPDLDRMFVTSASRGAKRSHWRARSSSSIRAFGAFPRRLLPDEPIVFPAIRFITVQPSPLGEV